MTNSKSWKPTKCCKEFCQFLDVDHVGDKDVLIQRAVEFLMKPTATNSTELNNEGVPLWRMQKVKKKVKRSRSDDSDDESSPEPKAKKSKKTKKIAKKKKKDKKKKSLPHRLPPPLQLPKLERQQKVENQNLLNFFIYLIAKMRQR